MARDFIKRKEDFKCLFCGRLVVGTGYTNHCPDCLYSCHVDRKPGDRSLDCKGAMRPIKIEYLSGRFVVTHKCLKCGAVVSNRTASDDKIGDFLADMLD